MNIKRNILLNPGPATTTDTVKLAQVVPDICPREQEFAGLMKGLRRDLVRIVHGDERFTSVLFYNGAYSSRAVEICDAYGLPHIDLRLPIELPVDVAAVRRALDENPDVAVVYTTHHETGSGVLNPIREIGAAAHEHGCTFIVDTTYFLMASAQKGLQSMTGLSFVVGREDKIRESASFPRRSYYCNLFLQYDYFEKTGEMHFTPPVQTIYATLQALKEYFAEGEAAKWARHTRVFEAIHRGLADLGFRNLIRREHQSGLVVSVCYPDDPNWSFEKIHDYCYERGFTIYPGKVGSAKTFRLCALGQIDEVDIVDFFKVFKAALDESIHKGHLNIIAEAAKLGDLTVGVLSDREAIRYNRFPMLSEEERLAAVRALPGVANAVIQRDMMYSDVIDSLRPDVIVHGDNWCNPEAPEYFIRQHVEDSLKKYGGEIVDIPYTFDPEAKRIDDLDKERLAMPEYRRRRLRQLIRMCPIVKTIEAHSGLTGLIAEKTVVRQDDGRLDQFDAMWVSSLCDSTAKGKPDIELVDMSSRLRTIDDIMEVTTKPIILDGDTGGLTEHFVYNVRTLERIGVSAVIIEDKTGLKKNSLFGTEVEQTQDTIENFCAKIAAGKDALRTKEFMIIARCESLILEQGMDNALTRCHAYVKAGADGIMIHSRRKDPAEILEFCDRFRGVDEETPIVVVPTSFNSVTEAELAAHGVNICIYANQLTRAAFPAMQSVAQDLLKYHRAQEVDSRLMPFKKIITLIDG